MKAVLRGKLTVLSAYIKKIKKYHTSDLAVLLKALEQKKQTHSGGGNDRNKSNCGGNQ